MLIRRVERKEATKGCVREMVEAVMVEESGKYGIKRNSMCCQ